MDTVVYLGKFSYLETTFRKRLQEVVREILVCVKVAVIGIVKPSGTFQSNFEC